jgi:hypothetical protein
LTTREKMTSAAKADTHLNAVTAALKRCATVPLVMSTRSNEALMVCRFITDQALAE